MAPMSKTKLKEQRIKQFLAQYPTQFDIEDSAIDLRTMVQNYTTGIIPSVDINSAVRR